MNKNKVIWIIVIILILGFVVYKKFIEVPGNIAGQMAIEELLKQVYYEEADNHLEKIFVKSGNIEDPLPKFDNINNAPEDWIWMVLYNNLENEENSYTYEEIQEKLTLLFSQNLKKTFPEEGIKDLIEKNAKTGKYNKIEIENNNKEYMYSIKSSTQEDNIYRINIIEYTIIEDKENYSYRLIDKNKNEVKEYTYNDMTQEDEIKNQIQLDINQQNYNMNRKEIAMKVEDVNKIIIISVKDN